jgi:hypothetical protein
MHIDKKVVGVFVRFRARNQLIIPEDETSINVAEEITGCSVWQSIKQAASAARPASCVSDMAVMKS